MGPDAVRAAAAPRPAGRRWLWVTLVTAFVVWHAVFDVIVNRGLAAYVERHARYAQGLGPRVTIRGVMDEAVSRGAWTASGAAAGFLCVVAVMAWARRRRLEAVSTH
jgi:hypothetical protein